MAGPPEDPDPFTDAPTLARRDRRDTPSDEDGPSGRPPGAWAAQFDRTLIRGQFEDSDGTTGAERPGDADIIGVTPEVPERYDKSGAELGRGGIGRVTIAFDRHLGREVAIKELLPAAYPKHPQDTSSDLARFLREARVTGQLEHPSIVPVYELGQRNDRSLYYSMKRVRGRTLRKAIDAASTFQERMALMPHFVDLANAIAYAHSRGVVHRDIKPENVMLGEFGETVVLDWGLAKFKDQTERPSSSTNAGDTRSLTGTTAPHTMAGEVVGTPAYMSPEQAEGLIGAVDERSDVWSLGAVLFEILTGRPPFRGKTVENLLLQVITADFEPIRQSEEDAPADLSAIAEKALSKKPDHRYPNAGALVEDVTAFLNGRQVAAYDYSAWELIKKFVRENRAATVASLLVTLTVAIGVIGTVAAYRQAVSAQTRAEAAQTAEASARSLAERNERRAHDHLAIALAEKARLLTDEHLDFTAAGVYAAAALYNSPFTATSPFRHPDLESRDPSKVSSVRLGLRSALYDAVVRRHVSLTATLSTNGAVTCAMAMTPDGRWLATTDEGGKLIKWDLTTQKPALVAPGPDCPRRLAIDPTRDRVITIGSDRLPIVVDLRTGKQRLVAPETKSFDVEISPDGRIAYLVTAAGEVLKLDAESHEIKHRAPLPDAVSARLDPTGQRLAVGTFDGVVEIFDTAELKRTHRFKDHSLAIWAIAFSRDGQRLAFGGYDGNVVVRSLDQPKPIARLDADHNAILNVAFTPGGEHLLAGCFERGYIWNIRQQERLQTFRVYRRGVQQIAVRPDNGQIVTGGSGPDFRIWRFDAQPPATRYAGHAAPIYGFASSTDGKRMATSDKIGVIRMWRPGASNFEWKALEPDTWSLAFTANNDLLSITSLGRVRRWSGPKTFRTLQEKGNRSGSIVSVDAMGDLAAWTGGGSDVVVYRVSQDAVAARLSDLGAQSTAVALGANGKMIAAGDEQGSLVVWNVEDRKVRWRKPDAHNGLLSGLDVSPDGRWVVSSGEDGRIRLWKSGDGTAVGTLNGHGEWVNRVQFSPDGRWLTSSSDDASMRVWALDNMQPMIALPALASQVVPVGFLEGGARMAFARGDALVVVPVTIDAFELPAAKLLERAERVAGLRLDGFELKPHATKSAKASADQPAP